MATYTPSQYASFLKNIPAFANNDLATAALFNASAEALSDNTRNLIDSLYRNMKYCILEHVKAVGTTHMTRLDTPPLTVPVGTTFNYTPAATTLVPGDFIVIVNAAGEITTDYILFITDVAAPVHTILDAFTKVDGPYNEVYKFSITTAYDKRLFSTLTSPYAELIESVQADINSRLGSLDEITLATSLGTLVDGSKASFTSTEVITSPTASYYTAINDLDSGFLAFSGISPDRVAMKNYSGASTIIKPTIANFCSDLSVLSPSRYSLNGFILGNESELVNGFDFAASDNGTINITGSKCLSVRITSFPGTVINSTVTINVQKALRELIIDGLSLSETGKIYITSTNTIERLVVKNCNVAPAGSMSDYWIEVSASGIAIGETIYMNNKSDTADATCSANTLYGIKHNSNGLLSLHNNSLAGRCYFSCEKIIAENNYIKCGLTTTGTSLINFIGDLTAKGNEFIMCDGKAGTDYLVGITPSNALNFTDNKITNTSTGGSAALPMLFKIEDQPNAYNTVENNLFNSEVSDALTCSSPCVYIGEYSHLKYNGNSVIIKNSLDLSTSGYSVLYIDTTGVNNGGELLRNKFVLNFSAGPAGGAGCLGDGAAPFTRGAYSSVILFNDPGATINVKETDFVFLNRVANIRLIERTAVVVGSKIYVERSKVNVKAGTDFSFTWSALPSTVVDDWYYPHTMLIDDGFVYAVCSPTGLNMGTAVINWATWVQNNSNAFVIDCGGVWDLTSTFTISEHGIYEISCFCTVETTTNASQIGFGVKNTSNVGPGNINELNNAAPGFWLGAIVCGSIEIPGGIGKSIRSASTVMPYHSAGGVSPTLQVFLHDGGGGAVITDGQGVISFTIRRQS